MCKCGAQTYEAHLKRCADGYPAHVYRGTIWLPPSKS
jgi:ribosomal protein L37E